MTDKDPTREAGLNPALKTRTDTTHDTTESSRPPAETASVQHEEGRAWPIVWLVVTLVCVLLAVWILFL